MTSGNNSEMLEHSQALNPALPDPESLDPELLDALSGLNTDASMVAIQRTRRAVRDAALSAMQVRRTRRRNAGIATLAALAFLVLLSPALWSFADELVRGEFVSDMAPMVTLLVALVLSGVLAALVASAKNLQTFRHGKRNT